jgi:polyhydroxybutyrate depolymerase
MLKHFINALVFLISTNNAALAANETVTFSDGRNYNISLPNGVENPPLILVLHGGGGNPNQIETDSGMTAKAMRAGFAVAYPAGSGRGRLLTWNAVYCCAYAMAQRIDDVAFLDRVVADAATRFGTDVTRTYVTGMSNGGMMAETYAAKRPGKVRAVASVAGTMDTRHVRVKGAMPLLHIHGTLDQHVSYEGGYGPDSKVKVNFSAVEDVVAVFVNAFGKLSPSQSVLDPANDGMQVERVAYTDNSGHEQVVLLRVVGGDHDWPGGKRSDRQGATRDINASNEILKFFRAH